jgi:hypothetical protein
MAKIISGFGINYNEIVGLTCLAENFHTAEIQTCFGGAFHWSITLPTHTWVLVLDLV